MSHHRPAMEATASRRVRLAPTRDDVIDAAALAILTTLALIGFRTTYSGWDYLIAGVCGLVLGLLIAHVASVLRQPLIAIAAMTLAAFFLLGGAIALRSTAIAGVLPTGASVHGLANVSVHGWKDLLTTLPPIDAGSPLLVLPYILGLLAGVGGLCLARRTRPSFAPVAAPLAVLIAIILLGTQTPAASVLQGAVFGAFALGWVSQRAQRQRPAVQNGAGRAARLVTAGVLLAAAGGGATLIGPHLPGVSSHPRTVLRSYVQPPINIDQYPSPLAGYRSYAEQKSTLLFTISPGLPKNTPVRIATLDAYNGTVWSATNQAPLPGQVPDDFQRVGQTIDNPTAGTQVSFTVHIPASGYSNVWLPDAGAVSGITFHGPDAKAHAHYFRYNLATDTGLVPDRLTANDSYTITTTLPDDTLPTNTIAASANPTIAAEANFLQGEATSLAGSTVDPLARVEAIATQLHTKGFYSDGLVPNEKQYVPGHYEARLLQFLKSTQIVGDDEQYAAAFALMANAVGVPTRVVLGAIPELNGEIRGSDVRAWVEVQVSDGTWRTISSNAFMPLRTKKPTMTPPVQQQIARGQVVPPPMSTRPHTGLDSANAADSTSSKGSHLNKTARARGSQFHLPAWLVATSTWAGPPTIVILLLFATIIALKALRRRRRRSRGSPATKFARGWHEIVDYARDLGTAMPGGCTRREQGTLLDHHGVAPLARTADRHIFGVADPREQDATLFWKDVDAARNQMRSGVGRWRRIRAALSVASLRRPPTSTAGASA